MAKCLTTKKSAEKRDVVSILLEVRFRCDIPAETRLRLRRDVVATLVAKLKNVHLLGDTVSMFVAVDDELKGLLSKVRGEKGEKSV